MDMLMVVALQSREEMRTILDTFPGADIYINASSVRPALSHAEYQDLGGATYNVWISKVAQIMMHDLLLRYRAQGADAFNDFMEGVTGQMHGTVGYLELTGFSFVVELERRFLTEEALRKYDASLGELRPLRVT